MKGNTVEKSDLTGLVEGFPIDIVQAMVDEQVRHGQRADVVISLWHNGHFIEDFDWHEPLDGLGFWKSTMRDRNFQLLHNSSKYSPQKVDDSMKKNESNDTVNHPSHYTSNPSGIECIDVTENYDFLVGNAIKYLWRAGLKKELGKEDREKEIEDLNKAVWYINRKIKKLNKNK